MKKIFRMMIGVLCVALSIGCFVACGPDDGGDGKDQAGVKTYTMEAEYIDLEGLIGAGESNEAIGVNMIIGQGSDDDKAKGWSNGYFIANTYVADLAFNFVFNSDVAATATIILRLGSEIGNITLTPSSFAVNVNGTAVEYGSIYVSGSQMDAMSFTDKTVTSNVSLIAGKNTISLVVLANTLFGGQTGGPMIDCVKIKTTANLTWTDKTDNTSRRGEI